MTFQWEHCPAKTALPNKMYLGRKGDRCAAELPVENYSFCTCGALGWNDVRYYTEEKACTEPLTAAGGTKVPTACHRGGSLHYCPMKVVIAVQAEFRDSPILCMLTAAHLPAQHAWQSRAKAGECSLSPMYFYWRT